MFLLRLIWAQQPSSKRPRWLNHRPSSVERSRANATGDVCPDALLWSEKPIAIRRLTGCGTEPTLCLAHL